jgi:hypothetical protein
MGVISVFYTGEINALKQRPFLRNGSSKLQKNGAIRMVREMQL